MKTIEISDRRTRLGVAPGIGGAVVALEALTDRGPRPILRPTPGGATRPFQFASNVLLPVSNRISGGGFAFGGRFHPVARNIDEQALPIHGDALMRDWTVAERSATRIDLTLDEGAFGPFRYAARMRFELEDGQFRHGVSVTNTGPRLPFGGGFHPWFPRHPGTRLTFDAETVWLADEGRIPTGQSALDDLPRWDFRQGGLLPADLLDNAFSGWPGTARIYQPELGLGLTITASASLTTALVFAPSPDQPFFCFEPVMHPVDALNMDGHPGMAVIGPGETYGFDMAIDWESTA